MASVRPRSARGSSDLLVPAVHPRGGGTTRGNTRSPRCGAELASAGGAIFARQWMSPPRRATSFLPEQRFYGGGPNDVRGYQRNEAGPRRVRRLQGALSIDLCPGRPVSIQFGHRGRDRGPTHWPSATSSFGCRRHLQLADAPRGLRRRGERLAAGRRHLLGRDPGEHRASDSASTRPRPARLDVAYNPYRLQAGPLFESTRSHPDGGAGQGAFVLDRKSM